MPEYQDIANPNTLAHTVSLIGLITDKKRKAEQEKNDMYRKFEIAIR